MDKKAIAISAGIALTVSLLSLAAYHYTVHHKWEKKDSKPKGDASTKPTSKNATRTPSK